MDALYGDPALAAFYDWDNPWPAEFNWFMSLLAGAASVLDLGCGTGVFSVALAKRGQEVVGVDPAAAMLAIARARAGGERVTWVESDAGGLDLGRRFDAVVMTGHAFQCLLTAADRTGVLAVIARHLAPDGVFLFDSRNPEAREWECWGREATLAAVAHPTLGPVTRWNEAAWDAARGVVSYETHYLLPDGRQFQARSQIAFPSLKDLQAEITAARLQVHRWYGDYAAGKIAPGCPELIAIGGRQD